MKYPFIAFTLLAITISSPTQALTVDGYLELKSKTEGSSLGQNFLLMYFQGISESVITLMDSEGTLDLGTVGQACIPSWRAVTADVMENSLIHAMEKAKKQNMESQLGQGSAATVAIYGLQNIFPCK